MKKIITLLLVLFLFPYKILAYGSLSCYGALNSNDTTTLEPGNTITLNLGVSGYSDTQYITDANYSLTYNHNVLEPVVDSSNNYIKIFNNWTTYELNSTKVDDVTTRISFYIGTTEKSKYFFDTSDSIIFAKIVFKVKDVAQNMSTYINAYDSNSYYTSCEYDTEDKYNKLPTKVYDVQCSSKRISLSIKLPVKDSNTNLKSLTVTNGTLNPTFDKNNTRYSVEVPYSTEKIYIAGSCEGAKCSVKGNGTRTLSVGTKTYEITVTAENGSTKVYSVNVTRLAKEKQFAYLKSLTIEGHNLEPNFKSTTLVYTLSLPQDTNTLKIYGICEADKCKIEGDGLIDIKEDTKTVSIVVTTDDDSKTYTFNILREDSLSNYVPNESGSGGFTTFLWIVFAIMIIIGVYYFYKKSGINIKVTKDNQNNKNEKKDNTIDNSWRYK